MPESEGYVDPSVSRGYVEVGDDSEDNQAEESPETEEEIARILEVEDKDLDESFALEKSDPKHRMGNFLYVLQNYYTTLSPKPLVHFFIWVNNLSVFTFRKALCGNSVFNNAWGTNTSAFWMEKFQEFQRGVKYREGKGWTRKYRIKFEAGLVMRRSGPGIDEQGVNAKTFKPHTAEGHAQRSSAWGTWVEDPRKGFKPFSTSGGKSHWSGSDFGIWVESPLKRFYSHKMKLNRFQHSSFLGGHAVRAAGEWKVFNGKIEEISGRSGHYKPKFEHLMKALADLKEAKVQSFDSINVVLFYKAGGTDPVKVSAGELWRMSNPKLVYKVDPNALD